VDKNKSERCQSCLEEIPENALNCQASNKRRRGLGILFLIIIFCAILWFVFREQIGNSKIVAFLESTVISLENPEINSSSVLEVKKTNEVNIATETDKVTGNENFTQEENSSVSEINHSLLVEKKYLNQIIRRAKIGDSMAQTILGLHFLVGLGVEKNGKNAQKLFLSAAKDKNPIAIYEIGYLYANGLGGLSLNQFKSQKWFKKSLDLGLKDLAWNGNYFAMNAYGDAFLNGNGGISKNIQLGLILLRKSADAGNPFGQYSLANILLTENITLDGQNQSDALNYLRLAAAQGHPDAQAMLDKMGDSCELMTLESKNKSSNSNKIRSIEPKGTNITPSITNSGIKEGADE
jgi:hypothetical protein